METKTNKNPLYLIKDIPVYGDLILAPMDGVSDLPFRILTRQLGSAISYTEFVNAIDVVNDHPSVRQRVAFLESERPVAIQVFDDDPDRLVEAGLRLLKYKPDFLDVNMGCPSKDVAGRGAGAGLLREPQKIAEIFRKLTKALPCPVTGKIRLGWDETSRNYLEVVKIIEDNGGSMVAVHGRTKAQSYTGQADWNTIAEVKNAVNIPVIGNGDVRTVADIERMKAQTGCDGIMIGRACIENPWILAHLDRNQVTVEQIEATAFRHLEDMLDFYGDRGLIMFRKFIKSYLRPYGLAHSKILALVTCKEIPTAKKMMQELFKEIN